MKKIRKVLTLILTVCFILPCFPMTSFAADGIIFFTDLDTSVGATFTITGTVVTRNDVLGNATVQMTYDSSYMRFIEGEGVTKTADGQLTFTGSGDGRSDRVEFDMQFQALQEGSTRMEQDTATVTSQGGSTVTCEAGYADISISAGDPNLIVPEATIEINGVTYSASSTFSASLIPAGFVAGEVTYKDTAYQGIVQENGDIQGLYLKGGDNSGSFYLYNPTKDTFYPCEEIMISDEKSIVILADTANVKLDSSYGEASMSINGTEFPAWTVPDRENFYVVYASNSDGVKGLYLYDSEEHTYQRMAMKEEKDEVVTPEEKKEDVWSKISNFVTDHFLGVFVGVVCTLIVGIVLLIVLGVKLRHRNLELDELYDEYGIDLDESPVTRKEKINAVDEEDYLDFYNDEYDDYEDDEYDEDEEFSDEDFEEEEDDLADFRKAFIAKKVESQKNYDEYYNDDDYEDDDYNDDSRDELKDSVNTDTFEMDFIDFD